MRGWVEARIGTGKWERLHVVLSSEGVMKFYQESAVHMQLKCFQQYAG